MARRRHLFWLDTSKEEQAEVRNMITELKQHRLYSKAIRDGIRLFYGLSVGNYEVLRELFPHVYYELVHGPPPPTTPRLAQPQVAAQPETVTVDTKATGEFLNMFDDFG